MRNPEDPVSTRIPSMVWHCEVLPGTHTVTEVNASLMAWVPEAVAEPVVTLMDWMLLTAVCVGLGVGLGVGVGFELVEELEPEPPAQPEIHAAANATVNASTSVEPA
jgi:hypothetical protein